MKIAFIGGGNMATALIGGLLKQGFAAADISAVEPFETARAKLTAQCGIACTAAPSAALGDVDAIVMAVKPQNMREAAQAVAPYLKPRMTTQMTTQSVTAQSVTAQSVTTQSVTAQSATSSAAQQLIVSIAAGTRIADLARWLGTDGKAHGSIVRCMPNTPALVGLGITGMCAAAGVSQDQCATAERILRAVGEVVWVESEALIDPVTAVSGSGPAYVFYFLEAMIEAGIKLGLDAASAKRLAIATFTGAAKLAADSSDDLATLRANVTSKGGTTAAALQVMMERQVKEAIGSAVEAASARGRELGEMLGRD